MVSLQTLLAEATKLNREIGRILKSSTYSDYGDLSELDIDTKDGEQIFLRDELDGIMDKLADAQAKIEYLNRPIEEVSRLHKNRSGQYETAGGHCFHSGSQIEVLISDEYRDAPYWTKTRVEHDGTDYYLVGNKAVKMDKLTVRVRKRI